LSSSSSFLGGGGGRAALWGALNADAGLLREALGVLEHRFWFVGILEELDRSLSIFCQLSQACGGSGGGGGKKKKQQQQQQFRAGRRRRRRLLQLRQQPASWAGGDVSDDEEEGGGKQARREGGRRRRSLLQKHSSKPRSFQLGADLRAAIEERNALDMAIYRHAKAKLKDAEKATLWSASG
jgi:hypothetical protein